MVDQMIGGNYYCVVDHYY